MTDFSRLFIASKSAPIQYNGKTVVLVDYFPVSTGDLLEISIESTASPKIQGLCIDVSGYCEVNGELIQKNSGVRLIFWEDRIPHPLRVKIFSSLSTVTIYNVWEKSSLQGKRYEGYGHYGSAMIVEKIDDGRRYRCNDWEPDDDFDDIIFTVEKVHA